LTRRSDPYSWTTVLLPERDLADTIREFASPLLQKLGEAPTIEEERRVLELAISFWNASVQASKRWERPRLKELNELKKRMRGRQAPREDAAVFDLLSQHWRAHWLDPRLVEQWSYEQDEAGARRLSCRFYLPEGVRAEVPPPIEKRISIAGRWLDEVRIRLESGGTTLLSFPVERHSAAVADGIVTIATMMPTALQLFAEGRLSRMGGPPVEVLIGGRGFGPMILTEVRCAGEWRDRAVLVFQPTAADSPKGT
jgi:hypothetical protein